MFIYKRKTSFIAYYINGIKSRSIGVVKQCLTEENLKLAVELFGLEDWKTMRCQVSIGNVKERREIFEMDVCNGKGRCEYSLSMKELQKVNVSKIFFVFGNDYYGIADLCEVPEYFAYKKEDKRGAEKEDKQGEEQGAEQGAEQDDKQAEEQEDDQDGELLNDCLEPQPDKWEVIKKKYPILYPFRGQGPYVSIKPVDLQLLDSKYHHLSNNSFLMHNFYQYKHLILGEYDWEKGNFFYVGVPGEFVKKEQNTAAMFGFEGYEHSGDLGYYLYRVEL